MSPSQVNMERLQPFNILPDSALSTGLILSHLRRSTLAKVLVLLVAEALLCGHLPGAAEGGGGEEGEGEEEERGETAASSSLCQKLLHLSPPLCPASPPPPPPLIEERKKKGLHLFCSSLCSFSLVPPLLPPPPPPINGRKGKIKEGRLRNKEEGVKTSPYLHHFPSSPD